MIWHAFAILAVSAPTPEPEPKRCGVVFLDPPPRPEPHLYERAIDSWQQDVIVLADADRRVDFAATERFNFDPAALLGACNPKADSPNRTTSRTPRDRGGRWYTEQGSGSRTPTAPHRICRGRP